MNVEMNNKSKAVISKKTLYFLSFFIPVVMMGVLALVLKIYPFGDNTIIYDDARNQIANFYSYFRSIILDNNDASYTLSKFMGGDMAGLTGYYLTNPFLLLLVLFNDRIMPIGIYVLTVLHVGAFGVACFHFFDVKSEVRLGTLIFSTGYAFMGIVFAYITLPIFFMAYLMTPFVMAGLIKLVRDGKCYEYIFSLAFMVICNFYQGYMACCFILFYFVYLVIKWNIIKKDKIKDTVRLVCTFIGASLISVALSAINLIPVVTSLGGTKNGIDLSILYPYRTFRFINVFSQFYTNAFYGNISNGAMPYVYVGFVAFVFMVLFFFNNRISLKDRMIALAGLFILLGCSYISTTDIILHGFNNPSGFSHRYAFLISFFVVDIAYDSFLSIWGESMDEKNTSCADTKKYNYIRDYWYFIAGAVIVIYSLYAYRFAGVGINKWSALWDIILLIIVILTISYKEKLKNYTVVLIVIFIALQCIDLVGNASHSIPIDEVVKVSDYSKYYDRVNPVISDIKSGDQGLYRIEKDFEWSHNDAMLFNYNGLSHYSSCEKDYVESFAEKMGFKITEYWTFYNQGSTSFIDSLLGVKYFISRFDSTDKPYKPLSAYDETYVYENPYALPYVIPTHSDMSTVDMTTNNLFEIQNEIVHEFLIDEDLLSRVDVENIALENVRKTAHEEDGSDEAYIRYEKVDPSKEAYIEYTFKSKTDDNLYLYFDAPHEQYTEITVNDAFYDNYFTFWRWNILKIGKYKEGEEVRVKLLVNDDGLDIIEPYFYTESDEVLSSWYNKVSSEKTELNKATSSHLTGKASLNEDGYLMFTLPREKGWTIKLDGIKTDYTSAFDTLIVIPATKGEHVIDMKYEPPGRKIGTIITLLAIAIVCAYWFKDAFTLRKE
ncbi:MAG: YfhO family protein [Lachnospiraceae bacterium]|nr:YfhO family protein [Lachnospiraceae bacterium]